VHRHHRPELGDQSGGRFHFGPHPIQQRLGIVPSQYVGDHHMEERPLDPGPRPDTKDPIERGPPGEARSQPAQVSAGLDLKKRMNPEALGNAADDPVDAPAPNQVLERLKGGEETHLLDNVTRRSLDLVEAAAFPCRFGGLQHHQGLTPGGGAGIEQTNPRPGALQRHSRRLKGAAQSLRHSESQDVAAGLDKGIGEAAGSWAGRGDALVETLEQLGDPDLTLEIVLIADNESRRHDEDAPGSDRGRVERRRTVGDHPHGHLSFLLWPTQFERRKPPAARGTGSLQTAQERHRIRGRAPSSSAYDGCLTGDKEPVIHEGEIVHWEGRCGPFDLETSNETARPSVLSVLLAEVVDVDEGDDVISLGCGCGLLSIVAAKLGAGRVFGVDTSGDVVTVASRNAARLGISDRTTFLRGDLFKPLPLGLKAEVIIGDVPGLPDGLVERSGWLRGRWGGGPGGSELPIRMLQAAKERLKAGGRLFLPTGGLQNEGAILKAARSAYGKLTQLTERTFTVPRALADTPALVRLVREKAVDLKEKGSRLLWKARVWECSGE